MTDRVQKKDWASTDWLLQHFWAKSGNRLRQMAALPIRAGDNVLDVGCGPGVYTNYVADLVGPSGNVVGIDRLEDSVKYASDLLSGRGCKHASAVLTEFELQLGEISRFDVVLFMNSLGYFDEPRRTIKRIAEGLKPGGRIIVKDYDLESIFLSPIDRGRLCDLIEGAWKGNISGNPLAFNNFFGREVPFLSAAFRFAAMENHVWTQLMTSPFTDSQRQYISGNILSLIDQARGHCDESTARYFNDEFVRDGGHFFNVPTAIFVENEYVSVMTK
jgi:SAM-dependent methyltransferase